jgi:CheY-like chemotaxis protein
MLARVLVVDPDPAMAGIIQFYLRRGGHQVVAARSGVDALDVVSSGRSTPDVAVIDVTIPGMTAFELLDELRAMPGLSGLGGVLLSTRNRARDSELGRQMGAVYLTKPLVAADLLDAVGGVARRDAAA